MQYKVLESNGVEIENIDGGAFNNFTAGGESGIVVGVLDECSLLAQGTSVIMNTGLLLVKGIRIKVVSPITFYVVGNPASDAIYHIVAKVELSSNNTIGVTISSKQRSTLTKQDLYKTNSGIYELEIATFTHYANGSVGGVERTCKILNNKLSNIKTEEWTFTLEDGSTVTKKVVVM